MHGVTHTLQELRHRGVPGFEVEVVSTDAIADRRLGAVADVEIPFYAGLKVGVPSLPTIVEALAEGRYDLVHLCTPGPAGIAALLTARVMDLPVLGSYHTELAAYAGLRCGRPGAGGCAPKARWRCSTRSARSCSRPARRATRCSARSASPPSASAAGTAASTLSASLPTAA